MSCEMIQAYRRITRKARKAHECCECETTIQPGEDYRYHSGVFEGSGVDYKQCLFCAEMYEEVMAGACYPEEGPAFEHLLEYITECEDEARIAAFHTNIRTRKAKGPTT